MAAPAPDEGLEARACTCRLVEIKVAPALPSGTVLYYPKKMIYLISLDSVNVNLGDNDLGDLDFGDQHMSHVAVVIRLSQRMCRYPTMTFP